MPAHTSLPFSRKEAYKARAFYANGLVKLMPSPRGRVAVIHRIADKVYSRKPISSLADPYALGPGRSGLSLHQAGVMAMLAGLRGRGPSSRWLRSLYSLRPSELPSRRAFVLPIAPVLMDYPSSTGAQRALFRTVPMGGAYDIRGTPIDELGTKSSLLAFLPNHTERGAEGV